MSIFTDVEKPKDENRWLIYKVEKSYQKPNVESQCRKNNLEPNKVSVT